MPACTTESGTGTGAIVCPVKSVTYEDVEIDVSHCWLNNRSSDRFGRYL